MSSNAAQSMANALGSLGGQYGNGQPVTATTTAVNYPGNWNYAASGYAVPVPQPPFPYDHPVGCVGVFRVRKLENGYLVEWQKYAGATITEYYAETLKDVGERIAALGVQKALEGDPK